jgi:hypothetical protein
MLDVQFTTSSQLSLTTALLMVFSGRLSITCYGVIAVNGVIEERSVGRKCVVGFDRLGILVDKEGDQTRQVVFFACVDLVCWVTLLLEGEWV